MQAQITVFLPTQTPISLLNQKTLLLKTLNLQQMKYYLAQETGISYTWHEREAIMKDLASKIWIQGAAKFNGQYLQLRLKKGAKMSNVKSILKKHFNIEYKRVYGCNDQYNYYEARFASQTDILRLCRYYLECNMDIEYYNHFDPLGEKNTVAKMVYQYGQIRYDLLSV
jgi:hypothetical protein